METLPERQSNVCGNPGSAGVDEKVHEVNPLTEADRVTEPPDLGRVDGVAVNEPIEGGEGPATVTLTGVAFTVFDPKAESLSVYVLGWELVLAGIATETVALPVVHDTVSGSSESAGVEEKTQFFVFDTAAASVTDPPVRARKVGVAMKEVTLGAVDASFARCKTEPRNRAGAAMIFV
jgi:hypothetical protein